MDFEFHFSDELEAFRKEVREFIEENALKEPVSHPARTLLTPELYEKGREMQRKLGARGWFAAKYPKAYGGGELDTDHYLVLIQEFARVAEGGRWLLLPEVSGIHTARRYGVCGPKTRKEDY